MTEWSPRVEHAFSQVSDWTWAKSHRDPLYHNIFGVQQMSETYLIVCGRERFLTDPLERERLAWRDDKTSVSSCKINFWTYDDLYTYTNALMVTFRAALGLRP